MKNNYVDDIVDSITSVTEAKELNRKIYALIKVGNFFLKGKPIHHMSTSSYSEDLQEYTIPSIIDKKGCKAGMTFDSSTASETTEIQKVLGIHWSSCNDSFQFNVALNFTPRKRKVGTGPNLHEEQIPNPLLVVL